MVHPVTQDRRVVLRARTYPRPALLVQVLDIGRRSAEQLDLARRRVAVTRLHRARRVQYLHRVTPAIHQRQQPVPVAAILVAVVLLEDQFAGDKGQECQLLKLNRAGVQVEDAFFEKVLPDSLWVSAGLRPEPRPPAAPRSISGPRYASCQ